MFDVLPGNARTNMQGEAIGFFTASEMIRDTIAGGSTFRLSLHFESIGEFQSNVSLVICG